MAAIQDVVHRRPWVGWALFLTTMVVVFLLGLLAASIVEHEKLMREAGAERYLRTNGWLKIYRTTQAFNDAKGDLDAIAAAGLLFEPLDVVRGAHGHQGDQCGDSLQAVVHGTPVACGQFRRGSVATTCVGHHTAAPDIVTPTAGSP